MEGGKALLLWDLSFPRPSRTSVIKQRELPGSAGRLGPFVPPRRASPWRREPRSGAACLRAGKRAFPRAGASLPAGPLPGGRAGRRLPRARPPAHAGTRLPPGAFLWLGRVVPGLCWARPGQCKGLGGASRGELAWLLVSKQGQDGRHKSVLVRRKSSLLMVTASDTRRNALCHREEIASRAGRGVHHRPAEKWRGPGCESFCSSGWGTLLMAVIAR